MASADAAVKVAKFAFLNAADSAALDADLMASPGFSIDQLMELAGLAVATATLEHMSAAGRVLVLCGPGNNGGDGLVAARHLKHFGCTPVVYYPRTGSSPEAKRLFGNLTKQLDDLGVPVVREAEVPWPAGALAGSFDCVVDALFGFSFRGPMREPYAEVVRELVGETQGADGSSRFPVVSVDVPSGWHVDGGDVEGLGLQPSCLIALTAPKPCTSKLAASSEVWLGGRFVPPGVSAAYKIEAWMGLYEGSAQVARVPNDVLREATAV